MQQASLLPSPSNAAFAVRESARARRLTVRVYPGGRVTVTVPRGTGPAAVQAFVARHRAWIDGKVAQYTTETPADAGALPARIELAATGDEWTVHYRPALRTSWRVTADRVLEVRHPPDRPLEAQRALVGWLTAEARRSIEPWLAALAGEGGFVYVGVQWRRQRTRWGSCSRRGTLSFNLALLFQPPDVARYLMIHELCHTCHMNHSKRYWSLVERHEPDWRRLDRELALGWQWVPSWMYVAAGA